MDIANITEATIVIELPDLINIRAELTNKLLDISVKTISADPRKKLFDTHFFSAKKSTLMEIASKYPTESNAVACAITELAYKSLSVMLGMPLPQVFKMDASSITDITLEHLLIIMLYNGKAIKIQAHHNEITVTEIETVLSFIWARMLNIDGETDIEGPASAYRVTYDNPLSLLLLPESTVMEILTELRVDNDSTSESPVEKRGADSMPEWVTEISKAPIPTFFL